MIPHFIAAAFEMAPGRAVADTGAAVTAGMALYVVPQMTLRAALQAWLDEMAHIELTPILLHGCGRLPDFDPEYQMFPIDPEEVAAMGRQASQTGKIVVTDNFAVTVPDGPPAKVHFGLVERPERGRTYLQEVAVRHEGLGAAIVSLLQARADIRGIHGFSDGRLADDAAEFDGRPIARVARQMAADALGHVRWGARMEAED